MRSKTARGDPTTTRTGGLVVWRVGSCLELDEGVGIDIKDCRSRDDEKGDKSWNNRGMCWSLDA